MNPIRVRVRVRMRIKIRELGFSAWAQNSISIPVLVSRGLIHT